MATSPEDFSAFVRTARQGGYECPYCHNKTWWALLANKENDPKDDEDILADFRLVPGGAKKGWHSFHAVSCQNCGHTTFFGEDEVAGWIEKNLKKKSS